MTTGIAQSLTTSSIQKLGLRGIVEEKSREQEQFLNAFHKPGANQFAVLTQFIERTKMTENIVTYLKEAVGPHNKSGFKNKIDTMAVLIGNLFLQNNPKGMSVLTGYLSELNSNTPTGFVDSKYMGRASVVAAEKTAANKIIAQVARNLDSGKSQEFLETMVSSGVIGFPEKLLIETEIKANPSKKLQGKIQNQPAAAKPVEFNFNPSAASSGLIIKAMDSLQIEKATAKHADEVENKNSDVLTRIFTNAEDLVRHSKRFLPEELRAYAEQFSNYLTANC